MQVSVCVYVWVSIHDVSICVLYSSTTQRGSHAAGSRSGANLMRFCVFKRHGKLRLN